MERDERWEHVWANAGPMSTSFYDVVEIRFEIYEDKSFSGEPLFWVSQRVFKDDIKDMYIDVYVFLLNEMVVIMDEYLDGTRK